MGQQVAMFSLKNLIRTSVTMSRAKKEQEETMKSNTIVLLQEGFYFLMENIKGLLAYKVARYILCLISD